MTSGAAVEQLDIILSNHVETYNTVLKMSNVRYLINSQ